MRVLMKSAVVMSLIVLAGLVVAGFASASGSAEPEWVNPDGTEQEDQVPEFVPVVDQQGNIVRCADGGEAQMPMDDDATADLPVETIDGKRAYKNQREAHEDLMRRGLIHRATAADVAASGGRMSEDTLIVEAGAALRPSIAALCTNFGSKKP